MNTDSNIFPLFAYLITININQAINKFCDILFRRSELYGGENDLPIRGLSEVTGMMEETVFRNMVRDSKIVTPGQEENMIRLSWRLYYYYSFS